VLSKNLEDSQSILYDVSPVVPMEPEPEQVETDAEGETKGGKRTMKKSL
jgi:hypothetical protein